jgi:hypothetical protein
MDTERGKSQGNTTIYEKAMEFRARGPRSVDSILLRLAGGVMIGVDSVLHPRSYAHLRLEFDKRIVSLYRERRTV